MKEETPDKISLMKAEELNSIISDILIEDNYESLESGYDRVSDFKANLRRNISKALSIKESEHQEQLKEIREKINGLMVENWSIDKESCLDILNQYIKG